MCTVLCLPRLCLGTLGLLSCWTNITCKPPSSLSAPPSVKWTLRNTHLSVIKCVHFQFCHFQCRSLSLCVFFFFFFSYFLYEVSFFKMINKRFFFSFSFFFFFDLAVHCLLPVQW